MFSWTEFDFTGFDNIDCSLVATNIKARRFNKTCVAFNGKIDMKSESFHDWEVPVPIW